MAGLDLFGNFFEDRNVRTLRRVYGDSLVTMARLDIFGNFFEDPNLRMLRPVYGMPSLSIQVQDDDHSFTPEVCDFRMLRRIYGAASHPNRVQDDDYSFTETKRAKRSAVWKEMNEVIKNGVRKAQCIHCEDHFLLSTSDATMTLKRHLATCGAKKLAMGRKVVAN